MFFSRDKQRSYHVWVCEGVAAAYGRATMSSCFCGVGSLLRSLCASHSNLDTDPCCMLKLTGKISGELHLSLDYYAS